MSTSHTTASPLTVEQTDAKKLRVTIANYALIIENFPVQDHFQNLPHYAELPHNTLVVVWTPSAGQKIHLVSLVVSTPASGYILLIRRTPPAADETIMRLEFNLRATIPFGLNTDLDFNWDQQLVVQWVADAASPTAYITAIGHEHDPENWPP